VKATATPTTLIATLPTATPPPAHPLAAAAPTTAPDRAPEQNAADARRFAELLQARRSEGGAPSPAAAPRSAVADGVPKPGATDTTDATDACDAPEPAVAPTATSSRASSVAKPGTPTVKHATAKATVDNAGAKTDSDADAAHDEPRSPTVTATVSPDARSPALAVPAALPSADAGSGRDATDVAARAKDDGALAGDAALTVGGQSTAPIAPFGARGKAVVDVADERVLAAASGHALPTTLHADATLASALGDVVRAAESASSRTSRPADASVAPLVAGSVASAPGEVRDAAAPATPLTLATPIDSPDFAAALGVQVSVLARDGVQHAELHLHPVETGPVSIRIEVDGTNARIDFGADLAATRHAIEQGLPELASALRDAGLTLAGGGVSQHAGSRPRGGDDGADGAHAQAPVAATLPVTAPARALRRIAAGGVDLYA
jgi:flagellar hook-length control protein FliK